MLYVAHLAFRSTGIDPYHGYLTTLIEADSIDAAVNGVRQHLLVLQKKQELLPPDSVVTLAAYIEIRQPSRTGFVMHQWALRGADYIEVSTTLPDASNLQAVAYQCHREDHSDVRSEVAPLLTVNASGTVVMGSNTARDGPGPSLDP